MWEQNLMEAAKGLEFQLKESDEVKTQIESVKLELSPIIEALQHHFKSNEAQTPKPENSEKLDPKELFDDPKWKSLMDMLEDSDSEALEMLEELEAYFPKTLFKKAYSMAESYEFDEVFELLEQWKSEAI